MDGKLRNMTSLYLTDDTGILCLYRVGSKVADKLFIGSAGGHFEAGELNDARACVLREMEEELGLTEADVEDLSMRYVTLRFRNGEIRQNYYFFGRLKEKRPLTSTEGDLHWIGYDEFETLPMPMSAKHMILHYVKTGRFTDKLYGGVTCRENTRFVVLENFDDVK